MAQYKTPDVYVQEKSTLPPSVAEVPTAIPVFVGYTDKTKDAKEQSIVQQPIKISNMVEYMAVFGGKHAETFGVYMPEGKEGFVIKENIVAVAASADGVTPAIAAVEVADGKKALPSYILAQSVELFFANGGGACYVVSVGAYASTPAVTKTDFYTALDAIAKVDEVTLICLVDAYSLNEMDYYGLQTAALKQCAKLQDRFTLMDVQEVTNSRLLSAQISGDAEAMRGKVVGNLKYGAAYYPNLMTAYARHYDEAKVTVKYYGKIEDATAAAALLTAQAAATTAVTAYDTAVTKAAADPADTDLAAAVTDADTIVKTTVAGVTSAAATAASKATMGEVVEKLSDLEQSNTSVYHMVRKILAKNYLTLPPSPAVAGVMAKVDATRGVWKAPANVALSMVQNPTKVIKSEDQDNLNVDAVSGKSINAIRQFTGKGNLVWGARTLAGNDNEWRYISVRRLFNMVEESIQKASAFAVFEPNTPFTWLKLKTMIESYLENLWKQGALFGDSPDKAFFVNVGLGQTMTEDDINNGIMNIEIGLAAVRPAEFIILTFSHKSLES